MARKRDAKAFGSGGSPTGKPSGGKPSGSKGKAGKSVAGPSSAAGSGPTGKPPRAGKPRRSGGSQVIPDAVAKRMGRRIAIATGIPTLLGMAVIVASYLLVSRGVLTIEPVVTLLGSGAFFLLGLVGLSYGVISASWEEGPGTVLGLEQIQVNIGRIRESVKAMQKGGGAG